MDTDAGVASGSNSLGFGLKFWYGLGQLAEGVKNTAFSFFLVFYFNQVLGLSGTLAGTAIFIALVFDAVSDPVAGSLSDRLRSRWGRRHPFMYASAAPLAVTFCLLFNPPPGLGQWGLFGWLLCFAILVRASMTLYHVPHLALGAELTDDYSERTTVVAFRSFFSMIGAFATPVVGMGLFLRSTEQFENGQLNPAGYESLAIFFAIIMFVTIIASGIGTHSRIPFLHQPAKDTERFTVARLWSEFRQAFAMPEFVWLACAMTLMGTLGGVLTVLQLHLTTFFWELKTDQIVIQSAWRALGPLLGIPFWAIMARRFDKMPTLAFGTFWLGLIVAVPPLAKIYGFYPPYESAAYFPILVAVSFLALFGASAAFVTGGSMMADVVDAHELRFGRRQEGVFFAAISFAGKAASGLGGWIAGIGIDVIQFPMNAVPGEVSADVVRNLGFLCGPATAVLAVISGFAILNYGLRRERVEEIQAALVARRGASGDAALGPRA
ncbi:MAG: MFS transporter [Myxococcales bacterium]|nr:MFS transporter [Myxococcales bacterium]